MLPREISVMLMILNHHSRAPQLCASLLLVIALMLPSTAQAAEAVSVLMKFGLSSFNVKAGTTFSKDAGMGLELRPQVNYEIPSLNFAAGLFYQGRMGSNGLGAFPLSRFGLAGYYYVFGLAISGDSYDNGVGVSQSRFAPFITAQVDYGTLAITSLSSTTGKVLAFNGLAIGYMLGGGIDIPLTSSMIIELEILLEGTLAGGASQSDGTEANGGLSIAGAAGFLGLSFHL